MRPKRQYQDYSPPIISKAKLWVVEFYWRLPSGQEKRFRIRDGRKWGMTGRAQSDTDRLYFSELCKAVTAKLASGYDPTTKKQTATFRTVREVMAAYLAEKKRTVKKLTYKDYENRCGNFLNFIGKAADKDIRNCDAAVVGEFFSAHEWSGTNAVNYRKVIGAMFRYGIKKLGIDMLDPTVDINVSRSETQKNLAYPPDLQHMMLSYLHQHEPDLHLFVCFEYYCFFRPSEIAGLEWTDIDMARKTATVWSRKGKSGRSKTNPLHDDMIFLLSRYERTDDRLFPHESDSSAHYKRRYTRLKNKMGVPSAYTLYSWKHTGCVAMYEKTKDIYLISRLCGHRSIEVTMNYLRSLGLRVNKDSVAELPSLLNMLPSSHSRN